MVRLLGIGDNTVNMYVLTRAFNTRGNAVNVAVHARRLGASASYLGCLGQDALGNFVHESLVTEDVDVSHCRRVEGPNPWCRIRHEGDDRVFAGSSPGVRACYRLSLADAKFIAAHEIAHTSVPSELDTDLPFIRAHAPLLSYDYSEYWCRPAAERTFAYVDIAFLSCPGLSDEECHSVLRRVAERGVGTVIATRGVRGSCALLDDGGVIREGIRPAAVVDTLGAGDAFIAGFLVTYKISGDAAMALATGAENAARTCTFKGAFGHGKPIKAGPDEDRRIANGNSSH